MEGICTICQVNTNTLNLDCKHKFCSYCLHNLYLYNIDAIYKSDMGSNNIYKLNCIKCEKGNISISSKELIENFKKGQDKESVIYNKCRSHNKMIEVYCNQCNEMMCEVCFEIHKTVEIFQSHNKSENEYDMIKTKPNLCLVHDYTYSFQCIKCKIQFCKLCKLNDHECNKDISYYYKKLKDKILSDYNFPTNSKEEFELNMRNIMNTVWQNLFNYSNKSKHEIQLIIDFFISLQNKIDEAVFEIQNNLFTNIELYNYNFGKLIEMIRKIKESNNYHLFTFLQKLPKNYDYLKITSNLTSGLTDLLYGVNKIIEEFNNFKITRVIEVKIRNKIFNKLEKIDDTSSYKLFNNTNEIKSLILLKDKRIATLSRDILIFDPIKKYECVKIFNIISGKKNIFMNTSENDIIFNCLIQLKDGRLVSGLSDNTIKIWNDYDDFGSSIIITGHNGSVYNLLQGEDGKLISFSKDKTIKVWDINENFKCLQTIENLEEVYYSTYLLSNGKILSSTDKTFNIIIDEIDLANCKIINLSSFNSGKINCFLQIENYLITGHSDGIIRLWSYEENLICLRIIKEHRDSVNCLLRMGDNTFISGSNDKTILSWNIDIICLRRKYVDLVKLIDEENEKPKSDEMCSNHILTMVGSVYSIINLNDNNLGILTISNNFTIWRVVYEDQLN